MFVEHRQVERPSGGSLRPVRDDKATISHHITDTVMYFGVPFRNAGTGLAVVQRVVLRFGSLDKQGWPSGTVVAPGEWIRVGFELTAEEQLTALDVSTVLAAEATYTNVSGQQLTRTRLELERIGGSDSYLVKRLLLFHGDSQTPFASSGPASGSTGAQAGAQEPETA